MTGLHPTSLPYSRLLVLGGMNNNIYGVPLAPQQSDSKNGIAARTSGTVLEVKI